MAILTLVTIRTLRIVRKFQGDVTGIRFISNDHLMPIEHIWPVVVRLLTILPHYLECRTGLFDFFYTITSHNNIDYGISRI